MRLSWTLLSLCFPYTVLAGTHELRADLEARYVASLNESASQVAEAIFSTQANGTLTDFVTYKIIGRARFDVVNLLEPIADDAQGSSRSSLNRRAFFGRGGDLELREAYLDITHHNWFFRVGKQQVVWGEADGLQVLDRINPSNLREFILVDIEDRKIPLWMINAERYIGNSTLQLLWIPDQSYNELPRAGFYQFSTPGFSQQFGVIAEPQRPRRLIKDSDIGLRLSGFSQGWDWSMNALYAYHDSPVIERVSDQQSRSDYRRSLLIGVSASNAFGKVTLRTELGYQSRVFALQRVADEIVDVAQTPELSGVLGLDYQYNSNTLFSAQLFANWRTKQGIQDGTSSTLSLLARREYLNDTLKLEALLLHGLDDDDGLLQLSLNYDLSSQLSLQAGVDLFYGTQVGVFGQFADRDRVSTSLTWSF